MNTNEITKEPSISDMKKSIALSVLMSDEIKHIISSDQDAANFMAELLFSYHEIDSNAVFGARHVADFLEGHQVNYLKFVTLVQLCDNSIYNIVLLIRGQQLGLIRAEDISRNLKEQHTRFDFDSLDKEINKQIKLNKNWK